MRVLSGFYEGLSGGYYTCFGSLLQQGFGFARVLPKELMPGCKTYTLNPKP